MRSANALRPATEGQAPRRRQRDPLRQRQEHRLGRRRCASLLQGQDAQADRVVYDRNANRVLAEGNARITDTDGTVTTADRFELTYDFKDGFVDLLRVQRTAPFQGRPVTTRFSAPRAERTSGETTVFEKGTYTACEPCADRPERPPLWQVRAARIIHNNAERMIYYEDARLEFAGVPIAWIPLFSSPDPTVKRKSGVLAPALPSRRRWASASASRISGTSRRIWISRRRRRS